MTTEQAINTIIKSSNTDTNLISDGYHTFGELYEHRITLFIALCRVIHFSDYEENMDYPESPVWRSEPDDGWFILGIDERMGKQMTYHLPVSKLDEVGFAPVRTVFFDGHTSADVLERLKKL